MQNIDIDKGILQNIDIDKISTASVKVRNCGLSPHADQTDEMVRIQAAFHTKGLIFPIMKEKWQ